MREIKLTKGYVSLVDDDDFEYVNQWKWYAAKTDGVWYAVREVYGGEKRIFLSMHRIILNTPFGMVVDHIDHNGLNNQRSNIRNCTNQQNCMNQNPQNKYKGLHFIGNGWIQARIKVNGISHSLGCFKTVIEAALAYNKAAMKYHGEFARLNVIEDE